MGNSPGNFISGIVPQAKAAVGKLSSLLGIDPDSVDQFLAKAGSAASSAAKTVGSVASASTLGLDKTPAAQTVNKEVSDTATDPEKRTSFLTGMVGAGGEDPEGILPDSVKIPKGQQKDAKIQGTIQDAAQNLNSLYMTYQHPDWDEPKIYHVEPYSFRDAKDGSTNLMAYDKLQKGIRSFNTDNIINVTHSGKNFDPRWNVEIGNEGKVLPPQKGDLSGLDSLYSSIKPNSKIGSMEHNSYSALLDLNGDMDSTEGLEPTSNPKLLFHASDSSNDASIAKNGIQATASDSPNSKSVLGKLTGAPGSKAGAYLTTDPLLARHVAILSSGSENPKITLHVLRADDPSILKNNIVPDPEIITSGKGAGGKGASKSSSFLASKTISPSAIIGSIDSESPELDKLRNEHFTSRFPPDTQDASGKNPDNISKLSKLTAGFKPGELDSVAWSLYGKENFSDLSPKEQQAAINSATPKKIVGQDKTIDVNPTKGQLEK